MVKIRDNGSVTIPNEERVLLREEDITLTGLRYGLGKHVLSLGDTDLGDRYKLSQCRNSRVRRRMNTCERKNYDSMLKKLKFRNSKEAAQIGNNLLISVLKTFHFYAKKGK